MIKHTAIADVFQIEDKIGEGAFAKVYRVLNKLDMKRYAAKVEPTDSPHQELYAEYKIIQRLLMDQNPLGVPKIYHYGVYSDSNVLVMELLGENLEKKLAEAGGRFSLKTVVMIADQVFKRLEFIHSKRILHRDIKPSNIVPGSGSASQTLYLIDFGKGKKFMDSSGKHIEPKSNKMPVGNLRYSSIFSDAGEELGRRDDLESVMFVLVHFLRGKLPWMGIRAKTVADKFKQVKALKASTDYNILCEGLIPEFIDLFRYIRQLKFDQDPDYASIKSIVKRMVTSNKITMDFIYDWKIFKSSNQPDSQKDSNPKPKPAQPPKAGPPGQSPAKKQ